MIGENLRRASRVSVHSSSASSSSGRSSIGGAITPGGLGWTLISTFAADVAEVLGPMHGSYGFGLELILHHTNGPLSHWHSDAPNPGWFLWRNLPP